MALLGRRNNIGYEPPEEALRFGHYIGAATKADCDKTTPHGLVDTTWGMLQQTQKYPTLTKDEGEVDVVVIGAGMVGLTVAYYLAKHGKSVAVLEGRTRGSGQTGRNPGHLMQWHNDWYSQVEQIFGEHNTQLVAESQLEAIAFLEDLIKDEEIDCDFTRVNGYLFPEPGSTDDEMKRLRDEEKVCEKAGMLDVRMVDLGGGKEVGGIREALLFPRSAEYHPLKFVNGLAEVVTRKYGVKIFEMSHVLRKELSVNGKIKAQSGGTIKAKEAVILATFTPINRNQAIHARMQPWRTYLIALAIPKGSVTPGNYWSSERKSTYIRVQKGGSQDLLLVGGRDHEHGQCVADYRDHWSELERWTRERFPQAGEVVKRWSGEVFVPIDLLGFYGPDLFNTTNSGMIPGAVMKYVATGDSGQATTGAAIAARVLGDLILRKANPWCDLYSPARLSTTLHPSSLQELGRIITITCAGFGTALPLVPRGVTDLQGLVAPDSLPDLKPGEGAVVQSGLFKIALYKDDKTGVLHKMSALCTHLGSLVTWNPNDSTFDCCCHGSSYDRYGRVLSGPSTWDLEDLGGRDSAPPRVTKKGEGDMCSATA
ncbi:DAO-domain-containing protein [Haematococcus lacustris]